MSEATVTPRPIRRTSIATNVVLQLLAGLLLLGVVNYLSFRHFRRWDLTRDQQFTLTPQTQGFLKSLRGKTDIIAVFPKGSEEEKEIRALLEEYKRTARARLDIDYLDLNREPPHAGPASSVPLKFSPTTKMARNAASWSFAEKTC